MKLADIVVPEFNMSQIERLVEEGKVEEAEVVFTDNRELIPGNVRGIISAVIFEASMKKHVLVKLNNNKVDARQAFNSLFK